MRDERGKSDRSVVPGKPPNKAGEPAAEMVEGRERVKGNSHEQTALRTPGRDRALSALERVRQAAERDRKQRFTALLHHVYDVEALRTAYHALKRDAAAGIDGETWQHCGEALEMWCASSAGWALEASVTLSTQWTVQCTSIAPSTRAPESRAA
jgi:RNA-directed DNA polymerase